MPTLQIRDLPSDLHEALAYRAERERRSLAQQAVVELRKSAELTAAERRRKTLAELRDRLTSAVERRRLVPSPEEVIRRDRER